MFTLLSALGSAASMISLSDQLMRNMEQQTRSIGRVGRPMASISTAKGIPDVARKFGEAEAANATTNELSELPDAAVDALAKRAKEVEQAAATEFENMIFDRVKIMQITDELRADMCTILKAIAELTGGELPPTFISKWNKFRCAA